jgi:pimeloyl-ACP methyl ester carboxylesterase
MGCWIALHMAMQRIDRVAGIVGVAASADSIQTLDEALSEKQREDLEQRGETSISSLYSSDGYVITRKFVDESTRWNLLDGVKPCISVKCPVHLLHGKHDVDIPWIRTLEVANALESQHVQTTLIEKGDHRLSTESDTAQILSALEGVLSTSNRS